MQPCNQGNIDFFCAVYAIINACRHAGRHFRRLDFYKNCKFYQYLMQYIIDKGQIEQVLYHGTEYEMMLELLEHAKKYIKKEYGLNLKFTRPYINTKKDVKEVCEEIGDFVSKDANTSCIIRFFNLKVLDHWSVISGKSYKNHLKLFDSYLHPNINITQTHWSPYKRDGQNYLTKQGIIFITIEA